MYLIKERLNIFFGFEPITTADPDLSVANGADWAKTNGSE